MTTGIAFKLSLLQVVFRVAALPTDQHGSDWRNSDVCTSFTIPLSVTAQHYVFDVVQVINNLDAVHYAQDPDTWNSPSTAERIVGNITISATYDIPATLFIPKKGTKKNCVHLTTHDRGFDSRYWAAEVEREKYSYVDATLKEGFSILTYDRIYTGLSSKPDAYREVQAPAEIEILRVKFDKVIYIRHSFGSFVTYGFTWVYSHLADAVIFTGLIVHKELFNQRETPRGNQYALQNDPHFFADYSSGYIVISTPEALRIGFFSSSAYTTTGLGGGGDPKMLEYPYFIRQPSTGVELGSPYVLFPGFPTAPQYIGPVQFVVGEFDFLICLGNCKSTYNETQVAEMFSKAQNVSFHMQLGTGNSLPFHHGAQVGFAATFDFLKRTGCRV